MKLIWPGDLFGELSMLTHENWKHQNIYTLEDAILLKFSNQQIHKAKKVLISFYS